MTALRQRLVKTSLPLGKARPVLLAAGDREPSDAPAVRGHGAADRRAAFAGRIAGDGG